MFSTLILLAFQNVVFERQQADEKARAEILDYRGRLEYCEGYDDAGPPDWRCPELKADAERFKVRFKDRPDLLRLLGQDSSKFERSIVIESHEWARPLWSGRVEHVAFDDKDRKYRITAETDGYVLKTLTIQMPGSAEELVITPEEPISRPDLQSIRPEWQANIVTIHMNFGDDRRWCFIEPDGQPELSFTIENGEALEASMTRYENCEPQSRDVKAKLSIRPAKPPK